MDLDKYKQHYVNPDSIWKNPVHFIACGFGVGCAPWAPGTFGTLLGVVIYLPLAVLGFWSYLVAVILVCVISMYTTDVTCRDFGVHDHPATVSDEVAGYLVTMVGLSANVWSILAGFVLFRLFDILKPGPIGWLDKHVHGGVGIVLDDIVAGVCASLLLNVTVYLWG